MFKRELFWPFELSESKSTCRYSVWLQSSEPTVGTEREEEQRGPDVVERADDFARGIRIRQRPSHVPSGGVTSNLTKHLGSVFLLKAIGARLPT